jgi:hypothetical protein
MKGFLVKKTFFNFWDNMFSIILYNLGFLIVFTFGFTLLYFFGKDPRISMGILIISAFLFFLYMGGVSQLTQEISDNKRPSIKNLFKEIKSMWLPSLIMTIMSVLLYLNVTVGIPIYLSFKNVMGYAGASILFWLIILWLLAGQFFYPAAGKLTKKPVELMKKIFILFFDNLGFSIFVLIIALITSAISLPFFLFAPGISVLLLLHHNSVKFLLFKYDYLEQNPEASKKKIPWNVLLKEEKEILGHRTLKNTIFPWKE